MTLTPITNFHRWIQGTAPLPAGAVPLAGESGGLVCLMPTGRWIMWVGGAFNTKPPETQKAVMEIVIQHLGGTAASVADKLAVSPRTVEAWRSGKAPLPIKTAYLIAEAIAVAE